MRTSVPEVRYAGTQVRMFLLCIEKSSWADWLQEPDAHEAADALAARDMDVVGGLEIVCVLVFR